MDRITDRLLAAATAVLVPLRAGDGLPEASAKELLSSLAACAEAWRMDSTVPKVAANLLVDLATGIAAQGHAYGGAEGVAITRFADDVSELIRRCVEVPGQPPI